MADIGVKMGVTGVSQFKNQMKSAQQSVKTLDAELKLNEKQYKASGNAEEYMAKKATLLKQQMQQQKNVIKSAEEALAQMAKNGVDKASASYQQMQRQLLNARSALLDMESGFSGIGGKAEKAASGANTLTGALNGINKKVSFDAVIAGIDRITSGMESAAKKIGEISRDVWQTMTTAAAWGDNEMTLSAIYGIDVDTLQRMQQVADIIDTPVEAIISARQKLKNTMVYGSDDAKSVFDVLGINIATSSGKNGEVNTFRDVVDVFWDAGDALLSHADAVERDAMAQKIFGRGWAELMPLFLAGRDAYQQALDAQSTVSDEDVKKLGDLDDAVQNLDNQFNVLKNTVLAELAPGFTKLAEGFSGLLEQFNTYLQTEEGQEAMQGLSDAVTGLFESLTEVDFSGAIQIVAGAIKQLTDGLEWLKTNKDVVVTAIEALAGAFGAMKVSSSVLTFLNSLNGAKNLFGGSDTGAKVATTPGANPVGSAIKSNAANVIGSGGLAGLAYAGAGALLVDQIAQMVRNDAEGRAKLDQYFADFQAKSSYGNNSTLGSYFNEFGAAISTGDTRSINELYKHLASGFAAYMSYNTDDDDEWFDDLFDNLPDEMEDKIEEVANKFANGEFLQPEEQVEFVNDIYNAIQKEIEKTPIQMTPDVQSLQDQLSSVTFTAGVALVPSLDGMPKANGMSFVPYDGYPAILHKGERVLTANQNAHYTANSNLYIENMNMSGGMDAAALAAAMAAQNRRVRAGFGS